MAEKPPGGSEADSGFGGAVIESQGSPENIHKDDVGNLTFDQYTAGGLGRHLGVFSTASLM